MYSILFQDVAGEDHFNIPFDSWTTKEKLNKGVDGSISVGFHALNKICVKSGTNAESMLTGKPREVKIFKGTTCIFYGGLTGRRRVSGREQKDGYDLTITDFLGLLASRTTPKYILAPTGSNKSDIVWNRIVATQAETYGDFGITRGTNTVTATQQKTMRFENIKDLIVEMSNDKSDDSFDMNIDANKQFNTWPRRGSDKPNIVINSRNYLNASDYIPLWGKLVNRVHVLGSGYGDDQVSRSRELNTHKALWGLHEAVLAEKTVSLESSLDSRGDQYLADHDSPEDGQQITVSHLDGTPDILEYEVGDGLPIQVAGMAAPVIMRVYERTLSYRDGHLLVTLSVQP